MAGAACTHNHTTNAPLRRGKISNTMAHYIETREPQVTTLRNIIKTIESKNYQQALDDLKALQSGVDWNWGEEDEEPDTPYAQWPDQQKLDGEIYGIRNSLHMANADPKDQHFAKRAILEIKKLIGIAGAEGQLNILTTTAAIAAEKDLEQYDQTKPGRGKN